MLGHFLTQMFISIHGCRKNFFFQNIHVFSDQSQPRTDTNNLQNMVITRNTTHLFGEFDRLLNTGDSHDYTISLTDPIYLISAVHPTRAMQGIVVSIRILWIQPVKIFQNIDGGAPLK